MTSLAYTLVSDGASDRALLTVLDWLLQQRSSKPFLGQWADFRSLPRPPTSLSERLTTALELYPCDLLFIHRDAETATRLDRVDEVFRAHDPARAPPAVPVVPVRMQEAWFLFDEAAIREAVGNPSGSTQLVLPPSHKVEKLPDPKQLLEDLMRTASELRGRRLEKLKLAQARHRLATLIEDFSPLRKLPAFEALEEQLVAVLTENDWARNP